MRLYFLRHGMAQERQLGLSDAQRALVPEGIHKTQRLAARLADYGVTPAAIYSSPLVRAHQTAAIVATHLEMDIHMVDSLAPGFDSRALQALVDQHAEDDDIMLVGHEPDFSSTISYLIGGGNISVKKGSLARIDLNSIHPLYGSLVWLVSPRVI
ncbi:MAG: phosphohistidine phosphatase SixA [Anaerolineales bacterium]